jgi:hypothetical protein
MTTEIPSKEWQEFCERITMLHRGAVSVRLLKPDGGASIIAEDVPLRAILFQKQNDACSDVMTVETALKDEKPAQYQIIEPIRVVLRKNDESGRFKRLEILAETGTTEITFNPGIPPATLQRAAP